MNFHMKAFRRTMTVALLAAGAMSLVAPAGAGGTSEPCPTDELDLTLDEQTTLVLTPECCGELDTSPPFLWIDCLKAHDNITDFLLTPGDYRQWEELWIDGDQLLDGLPNRKRVIRYDGPGRNAHPVQRADGDQAIIDSIKITGAHHWIIHGLKVTSLAPPEDLVSIRSSISDSALGSSNIILDHMLVENASVRAIRIRHSDDNCVQNSVLRDAALANRQTVGVAIKVAGGEQATGNRIVNNEILNHGDAIVMNIGPLPAPLLGDGTIIADNDLYVTPDYLALLNDGMDGCIENAIDLKIASSDPDNPVRIFNNRIWGYRRLSSCGGGGEAVNIQKEAKHIHVCQNVIFDVPRGHKNEGFPGNGGLPGERDVTIERNLFYGIQVIDQFDSSGSILRLATPATLRHNTFSHSHQLSFMDPLGGLENVFEDNVVIAVENLDNLPADFAATNQIYDEPPPNAVDFSFLIKRWTGLTTMTLPLAVLIETCPWDVNGDGSVNVPDLLALLAAWGTNHCGPPDFDGDHMVAVPDLLALLANWGQCP